MPDDLDALMTLAIHAGEDPAASAVAIHPANSVGDTYGRHTNPTVEALEAKFQQLEGGGVTVATATGMAAISQTLLALLRTGDRLVVHCNIFVGVRTLLADYFPGLGIRVDAVDMRDLGELARALQEPAAAVYFETVSNPHINVIDAPRAIAVANRAGIPVIVDNTLLSPCLFRPLAHGADVVVHSASKYIGGHGDALGGLVTARDPALAEQIRKARRLFGGMLNPHGAYLLLRGLKTLPLRIERHCANAVRVAELLAGHPRVVEVNYPSLASSPDRERASSFLRAFGGLMSFRLAGGEETGRFRRALVLGKVRFSFGEPGTILLTQDWTDVIRLSVGLEDPEDILRDIQGALDAI
ncbi:MAG TPA: PLP-dependent transferase [Thermoanaerobaculia bacterium]|nr:PLP-dependent transferase [Thermoanaerobaculia bacterium]